MKKKIVIIVPGAKFIKSRSKFMQGVILSFYRMTRVMHPVYSNYADGWRAFFSKENKRVLWLHWSRGFTNISKWFAVRKLKRLIKHYESYDITLIGMSLGGEIVLEAAEDFQNNIKKIIVIGSTNERARFNLNKCKIVNIYSESDSFQKFAVGILSPVFGCIKLIGDNVTNVNLPGITHDAFFANRIVKSGKFKNKTISEVIEYFVKNEN